MSFPQVKEALREPTRPPVESAPELNGMKRLTILDVPAFQEVPELGIKRDQYTSTSTSRKSR